MGVYNVHGGHNRIVPGASHYMDEVTEDRRITAGVIALLKANGHTAYNCTDDTGKTVGANLANIVAKCNTHTVDLDISFHQNAAKVDPGDGKTKGVEVFVYSKNSEAYAAAERACAKLSALGFTNRGVKISTGLYVLKHTHSPAMLIEVGFVDDKDDANLYNKIGVNAICKAITEGILNKPISGAAKPTAKAGWVHDNTGWWYRNTNGSYPKNQWSQIGGDWYWFDSKGYAIHDTWKQIKGHWYYFKTDCRMVKGWRKVDGKWYYLSKQASKDYPEGSMRDGWLMDGRYWYYLNPKKGGPHGAMCNGFIEVDDQTYYCRPKAEAGYPEGSMVTGKKMIDGKEYYFEADGRMKI